MPGISRNFFEARVGEEVRSDGRNYRITHVMTLESVMAVDLGTGESKRLRIESLSRISSDDQSGSGERDLLQYTEAEWAEAQTRLEVIKPLLAEPLRTRSMVESIAEQRGVHPATVYKWMKSYQLSGHVAALVPSKRGRKVGARLLSDEIEEVIQDAIKKIYLNKERGTTVDVAEEVTRQCRVLKLRPPNHNSIRLRIADLSPALKLIKRGRRDEARDRYSPILGKFPGAEQPYALVQIDHTPVNVIVVDEVSRQPVGRPYLTLAIDVNTRIVAGLYLSLDPPSVVSVGLCLSQAICPKREYLAHLGVAGDWPVWGVMGKVHCDNAKEFRSRMLDRACEDYGIDLEYRPKRTPHFGGHIERLMGVSATIFSKIPGKTFSNPAQRKGYNSEAEAVMTLRELEAYLVDHFINVYHGKLHSELKCTPLKAWEKGILGDEFKPGIGIPRVPEDPLRVKLDFMPYFSRTCQRYGFRLDHIEYYDPVLDSYINAPDVEDAKKKREFLLRRDPRDISVLYMLDPADNRYVAIPYRNLGHPAVSLWEVRAAEARLRQEGMQQVDEERLFETIDRLRERIDDARAATKAARRSAARRPPGTRPKADKPVDRKVPIPAAMAEESLHPRSQAVPSELEQDPFDAPITPFDVSVGR
jgi:putative transposase